MKLISVNSLQVGSKLSSAIRMQDGRILLPANATITQAYLMRLAGFGIMSVYIEDEFFDDVLVKPCLTDETKTLALGAVASMYNQISAKKVINETEVKRASKEIASDIKSAINEPIGLFNMYSVSDYRCLHAVNVASIVAALAIESGCNYAAIEEYTQAALLHDIMLDNMPNDWLIDHAERGYTVIKGSNAFSVRTYMGIMQHHEKFDGSGGPRRLKGKEISDAARMIAVADMYDNLIYGYNGNKLNLHQAVEYLNMESGKSLDPEMVNVFNACVAIYPTGATVFLNNGYKAVVVGQNEKMPTRPKVRLSMPTREECLQFNLLTQKTIFIERVEL